MSLLEPIFRDTEHYLHRGMLYMILSFFKEMSFLVFSSATRKI